MRFSGTSKKFSVSYWNFLSISHPNARKCIISHHFCNYQLTKQLSSQRYVRGKQREKCLIDFQRYPAELFLFMFYPFNLFQWVKSTCKIDPWNNKFIYTCVLDEIAVNFDIVLLWSSFESIFESKKYILYHKFGSNEKANTHGLHLLRGDFDEVRENERQIKKWK